METLESSRLCRLCGKYTPELAIDIFDSKENHLKKINRLLPILIHEMDFLPKYMCVFCNYKLTEFYNFYNDCLQADHELKSQLSWMQPLDREGVKTTGSIPMVQIKNYKLKDELDLNLYEERINVGGENKKFPLTEASVYPIDEFYPYAAGNSSVNNSNDNGEILPKDMNIESVKRNLFSSASANDCSGHSELTKPKCPLVSTKDYSFKNDSMIAKLRSSNRATFQKIPGKQSTKMMSSNTQMKRCDLKLMSDVKVILEKLNIEKTKFDVASFNGKNKSQSHTQHPRKWSRHRNKSIKR